MSRTLLKDTFREIKHSLGRFMAIFGIVLIGAAFFAGVTASSHDMKYTADKYFDDNNVMDIRLLSTLGFDENDIAAVREADGVEEVMAGYSMDAIMTVGMDKREVALYSYSPKDSMNLLTLVEGRMPTAANECVIRREKMKGDVFELGQTINISSGTDNDISDSLSETEYTVVGYVSTAYYLSYQLGSTSVGDGDIDWVVYLPEENFTSDVYNVAYVTAKGAKELNSYEDEYWDVIEPVTARLENIATERIEARLDEYGELNAQYGGMLSLPTEGEWYVLDRNSHFAYVDYEKTANQMSAIAKVFPVFFYVVAALVCLTTMTRMIDEQRGNIGTLKALGYSKMSIALKFIIYALLASLFGGIIGAVIGMFVFPYVIYSAWNIMYTMPDISFMAQPMLASLSVIIAVLVTVGATFWACYSELVETPALLMRPKAPKVGKKILLERIRFIWKRTSFTYKVTFRNLFRYKKRFFMTVIGISGCTALLIAGFGIKDSISQVVERQYGEIFTYDMTASFAEENAEDKGQKITAAAEGLLSDERVGNVGTIYSDTVIANSTSVRNDAEEKAVMLMAVSDKEHFSEFVKLYGYKNHDIITIPDSGVVASRKLVKDYGLKEGDDIYLLVNDILTPVKIVRVAEMYVSHYVFMSGSYYEELFGEEITDNVIMADLNVDDEESENDIGYYLINELGAESVTYYTGVKERFDKMISALDIITVVLIISAGALAFVVLYNLINVNISERIREIATIKVLGFYENEVAAYVYRENIILTLVGGAAGLGLGVILHHFIMEVVELDDVMFGRNISLLSFVLSYAITLLFALFVHGVMRKRLKNIPMIESLKSVE